MKVPKRKAAHHVAKAKGEPREDKLVRALQQKLRDTEERLMEETKRHRADEKKHCKDEKHHKEEKHRKEEKHHKEAQRHSMESKRKGTSVVRA